MLQLCHASHGHTSNSVVLVVVCTPQDHHHHHHNHAPYQSHSHNQQPSSHSHSHGGNGMHHHNPMFATPAQPGELPPSKMVGGGSVCRVLGPLAWGAAWELRSRSMARPASAACPDPAPHLLSYLPCAAPLLHDPWVRGVPAVCQGPGRCSGSSRQDRDV